MGFLFSKPSGDTFLSQVKNTRYARALNRPMEFSIFLHRGGVTGHFHDRIVLASEERYGCVTLELDLDENKDKKIIPKCEKFEGNVEQLKPRIKVMSTFKELADDAMEILRGMQEKTHNVIDHNHCQKFCNDFLERMGAETYMTTPELLANLTRICVSMAIIWTWTTLTGGSTAKLKAGI